MAAELDFHDTTKITLRTSVFETFKCLKFTITDEDGQKTEIFVFSDDLDLEIEDKTYRDHRTKQQS
jgi:hypothetical protein